MNKLALVLSAALAVTLIGASNANAQPNLRRGSPVLARGASDNDSLIGLYLAGSAAMDEGRSHEAADLFARASEMADGEARDFLRGQAFRAAILSGDIDQASQLTPQDDSDQSTYQLGRLVTAVNDLAGGDAAGAAKIFEEGVGQPYRAAAILVQPWAVAAAQGPDAGLQAVSSRGDGVTQLFSRYNRAVLAEMAGRMDTAEDNYKGLLLSEPDYPDFVLAYGGFLERQNRAREAAKLYEGLLAKQPGNKDIRAAYDRARRRRAEPPALPAIGDQAAQALYSAAMAAFNTRQEDNALVYFFLALRLDPQRADVLILVARLETSLEHYDQARAYLDRVPADSPEQLEALMLEATTYSAQGDEDGALKAARQAVERFPHDVAAQTGLAQTLYFTGHYDEASDVLTRAIREAGRGAGGDLYYFRALALHDSGDWNSAERDLQTALKIEPDNVQVMNYLGYMWADRNEHLDQALNLLERAAKADPNNGAIADSLGWAYFRLGRVDDAVTQLEKAVEMTAYDPVVNDHLGDVYLKAGRPLEALYQWERVLTLSPDDALKAEVEGKIATAKGAASTVARAAQAAPQPAAP